MKVLLSGANSFTGLHLARDLHKHFEVYPVIRQRLSDYPRARQIDFEFFGLNKTVWSVKTIEDITSLIRREKITAFLFHHFPMKDYRSPDYSSDKAYEDVMSGVAEVFRTLGDISSHAQVIFTRTAFELHPSPLPYAQTKTRVWNSLKDLAKQNSIRLSAVFLQYPIGPADRSDRAIPRFLRAAQTKSSFEIQKPAPQLNGQSAFDLYEAYQECLEGRAEEARVKSFELSLEDLLFWIRENLLQKLSSEIAWSSPCSLSASSALCPFSENFWESWREFLRFHIKKGGLS